MKSTKRQNIQAAKRARTESVLTATGKSNYARKAQWLAKKGLSGWEVPAPKPWKVG